jgi:hypothetical protein
MKQTKIKITNKDIKAVEDICEDYIYGTRKINWAKKEIQDKKQEWEKLPEKIEDYEENYISYGAGLADYWLKSIEETKKMIALGEENFIAETVKKSEETIAEIKKDRMDHAISFLKAMQELSVKIGYEPCEISLADYNTETVYGTPVTSCGKKSEEIFNQAIQIRDAKKLEKQNDRDAFTELKIELVKTGENKWQFVSKEFVLAAKILNVLGDQIYFHTEEISGGIFVRSIKDWLQITDGKAEIEIAKDGIIVREIGSTAKMFLKYQPYQPNKNSKIVPFVLN